MPLGLKAYLIFWLKKKRVHPITVVLCCAEISMTHGKNLQKGTLDKQCIGTKK